MVFKRWEPTYLVVLWFLLIGVPSALARSFTARAGLLAGVVYTFSLYWSVILASVTFYRLSPIHPMARYPGPLMCKLTKFWGLYKERDGKQHLYVENLHHIYGDVVRIGKSSEFLTAYRI